MPQDTRGSKIAGLVLAAGASSRLGENKLLLEMAGEPLVRRAARQALAAGLSPVVVVLGYDAEPVAAALDGLPVTRVVNPDHREGMPSSLRAGITSLPPDCSAAVVHLPDMPLVTAAMLAELAARFRADRPSLVITLYGDTPAPPTLYSRSLFPALVAAREGGRQVVREHGAEAAVVRRPGSLLVDVDLPEDLERLRGESSP